MLEKKSQLVLLSCAVLACSGFAAEAATHANVAPGIVQPAAAPAANCGKARICAYIIGGGGLARAKNVAKVTHPGTGVYCVTPKSGVITLSQITPLITPEWGSSSGDGLLAYYSESKLNCAASTLEIHTFDTTGTASNGVSFYMVVD